MIGTEICGSLESKEDWLCLLSYRRPLSPAGVANICHKLGQKLGRPGTRVLGVFMPGTVCSPAFIMTVSLHSSFMQEKTLQPECQHYKADEDNACVQGIAFLGEVFPSLPFQPVPLNISTVVTAAHEEGGIVYLEDLAPVKIEV